MKGLTLVEILISAIIFAVIIVTIYLVMIVGNRSWYTTDTNAELRQEIIRGMMQMQNELSQTRPSRTNIPSGSSASTITFSPALRNNNTIALDSSGNIVWSSNITYSLNGQNQIIRSSAGNTSVLARDISTLRFTRPQDKLMQIDINATKTSNTGKIFNDTEEVVVKIRN